MEIKAYAAIIFRRLWLIILGVIIAGGTAFFVSQNMTPVYQASSRLLIDEAPSGSSSNEYAQVLLEERLAQTYVEILTTLPVLEETINRLNLDMTPGQLSAKINASAPTETQIINIVVSDTDPYRAAEITNTLVEVFIEINRERESLRYAEPISNWQARMADLSDQIATIETEINALSDAESPEDKARLSQLETQLREAQIRYTEAFNNLNELQVSQAKESSNIIQIEEAVPNLNPVSPRVMTNTLLAAVVGGMAALGLIFLLEYLDDTVKSPDDIAQHTGLSTLGTIAEIKGEKPFDRLITYHVPRDPISEAFRVLRTNLTFSAVDGGLHSILVTSSAPSEGKSNTAANLAIVMAQTGKKVLIIDADLRRPTQHKIFKLTNNQGLTTAIVDSETPVQYHAQKTEVPNLTVMSSGPIPPNPAELLGSQRFLHVLKALQKEVDLIVIDMPPVLSVADAAIVAPHVTGCLLVSMAGSTRLNAMTQAVESLQKANANIFGVILNRIKPGRSGYYSNYYYYHYEAYANDFPGKKRKKRLGWLTSWLSVFGLR